MKSSCLLIAPPGELNVFPRGIMEIAGFLNRNACPTEVLPLGYYLNTNVATDVVGYIQEDLDKEKLEYILTNAIQDADPSVIGISNIYTKDTPNCLKILSLCKKIRPDALTVLGGHHATFCDAESLQSPDLDIVVRGEGEWIMLELLGCLAEGRDYRTTRGISFRANGQIHRNPSPPPGRVSDLPPVDFTLLPQDFVQSATIHGILTRGCAYNCSYCVEQNYWGKPRQYRLDKLLGEMAILQKKYHTQMAGLEESMLDMRSKRFYEFCRRVAAQRIELPAQFYITTRIDAVRDDGVKELSLAGIGIVCVGIESFSERVLKKMNKRQSADTIRQGCEKLKKRDIWTNTYWLIGHPGDNRFEAEYTYSKFKSFFEKGLLHSGHAFAFVPYPGTPFFSSPREHGILIGSTDWKRWRRWADMPISWLEDFSAEEISRACRRAWELLKNYRRLNTHLRQARLRIDPLKDSLSQGESHEAAV